MFEAHRDPVHPHTVHLIGELDVTSCDVLEAALREAARPGRDLVVDCGRLRFIDAAGIAVLVRAARMIGHGHLRLTNVRAGLAELIDLLHLAATVPNLRHDHA
ncbi:STAS domain-containing protein [Nonomuraea sp. FMUSA5-5]|uniref:STAS domain-containing protein n=1 Tax=Nonomuraea composti TaxID=2720023 RepID=A0ABX1BK67_9ACTN|nr:STAS domain-containing protein [Nonomuraea sp. FMUSA5-5]NJP95508.1 STAS domain-containing protein [Nonomuraea sp. FMUSA5-5]